jgi:glucosamine 6-phosphate synthetase-like amidotransferase/phosphosugar isomerase protein
MTRELNSIERAAIKREQREIDSYEKQLAKIEERIKKFISEQKSYVEYYNNLKKMKLEIIAQIEAGIAIDEAPACVSPNRQCPNPVEMEEDSTDIFND